MYLISTILLLFVPTVFGDFEQLLKGQYEPAIEVQEKIDLFWREAISKQDRARVQLELEDGFIFYGPDGLEHDKDYFIDEFLFKLNTSITPEVFDIQNLDPPSSVGDTDELAIKSIKAAVQLGGNYMYLEFNQVANYGYRQYSYIKFISLLNARLSSTKPQIVNKLYKDFATNTVIKMISNQPVFASEFAYQTCKNETIRYAKKLTNGNGFSRLTVGNPIHYYVNDHTEYEVLSFSFHKQNVEHLVQFEVSISGDRKHLFEVDYRTGKVLRGMDNSCGEL